jgi:GntR family transcriptional regulator/MocR family aminotransferase
MVEHPTKQMAFNPGVPAYDAFSIDTWSSLASQRWRFLQRDELVYGDPAGYEPLREAVANYLHRRRGVRCDADQIIITAGSQHAFTLAARVLIDEGDDVFVEDPGYPLMRTAFSVAGAQLHSVPVDDEGIKVSVAQETVRAENIRADLIGVTPSHQYPLGTTMSLSRRLQLLDWSAESDAWILEDDYDSGYRYSGRPIAALQGLDRRGSVLYVGTFSKVLFPALRLGYLVVPKNLVDPFIRMRDLMDRSPPRVSQMILLDFIEEGHLMEHLQKMRTLYLSRKNVLTRALNRELGDFLEVHDNDAGLHLVGWLPKEVDDQALCRHLRTHDLLTLPVSTHSEGDLERGGLLLGFGCVPETEIEQGAQRMAQALESFRA